MKVKSVLDWAGNNMDVRKDEIATDIKIMVAAVLGISPKDISNFYDTKFSVYDLLKLLYFLRQYRRGIAVVEIVKR